MDIGYLRKRKENLLKSIENVKAKRREILDIVGVLVKRFNSGRISKFEYERELSKALGGKSVKQWIKYYDDYLIYYKYQLKLCDELIKDAGKKDGETKRVFVLKSLIGLVLIGIVISLMFSVGPVIFENRLDVFGRGKIKGEMPSSLPEGGSTLSPTEFEGDVESEGKFGKFEPGFVGDVELFTYQYPAVVGESVMFKTMVKGDLENLILPAGAKVNQVYVIEDGVKREIEFDEREKGFLKKRVEVGITGNVVGDADNGILNYEVIYELPGPEIVEEDIKGKNIEKRVTVKGREDNLHFQNILAFTSVNERLSLGEEYKIKIYRVFDNRKEEVSFNAYDTNENGLIDYIEWIVPELSQAVFEIIIEINKAEHLDSNKNFISNIYEEVKALDKVWSERIYNNEYVRVTFEKELDSSKDITVYVRGEGRNVIEVYRIDSEVKIAEFSEIVEGKNKVYLSGMNGVSDGFDLRVRSLDGEGYLKIDYIVDPVVYVNNCMILDQANTTYKINNNIINNSLTGPCISITAENITLDFQGYYLKSDNDYAGVYSDNPNTTIKNCNISMGSGFLVSEGIGILLEGTASSAPDDSHIFNCILNGQFTGLSLSSVTGFYRGPKRVLVEKVNLKNNKNGIFISYSANNTIRDSNFNLNSNYDVNLLGASVFPAINNTFINTSYNIVNEQVGANSELIRKWYYMAYVNDTGQADASDSKGSNNGAIYGNPIFEESGLSFNGSNYVEVPDNPSFPSNGDGEITVAVWVKTRMGGRKHILFKYDGISPYEGFSLYKGNKSSRNLFRFWIGHTGGDNWVGCDVNIADGQWHYLTGTAKTGELKKVYFDGKFCASNNAGSLLLDSNISLYISGQGGGFKGNIEDVKIWNVSLNSEEIYQDYLYGSYVRNQNLVSHWTFENVVPYVNVTAFNKTNNFNFNLTTDSSGYTDVREIIDYVNLEGNKIYYSNYTIYADNKSLNDSHSYNASFGNNLKDVFTLEHVCSPPVSGDWEVNGTEVCKDREINISGNVHIRNGDVLKFYNISFNLKLPSKSYYDFFVYSGGKFISKKSKFDSTGPYYYFYNYGESVLNNVSGTASFYIRNQNYGDIRISNDSNLSILFVFGPKGNVSIRDSYLDIVNVYSKVGGNVNVLGIDGDLNSINNEILSLDKSFNISLSNFNVGSNGLRFLGQGGLLNITSSNIHWLSHYSIANGKTYFENSELDKTYYFNRYNTNCDIKDVNPPYILGNGLTDIISCLNGNDLVFKNAIIPSGGFYQVYTRYAGSNTSILNSTIGGRVYNKNGAYTLINNSDIYRVDNLDDSNISIFSSYNNITLCYGAFCYLENISVEYLYSQYTSQNIFKNVSAGYVRLFGDSNSTVIDSDFGFWGATRRTIVFDGAVLNFKKTGSEINELEFYSGSYYPTIKGFVNITSFHSWGGGTVLNRYFPFKVINLGMPVLGINVSIWDGNQILGSGLTGIDGMIILNISTDNSANLYYNYSVYLNNVFKRNITMLENTYPDGIIFNLVPDPPEIVFISDINGYENSLDVPGADRDLLPENSLAKRFEFYVWSEDLNSLPIGTEVNDNNALLILKGGGLINERRSSDVEGESCIYSRDDSAPVGSVGHVGEIVRVYSCKVGMWYYDDYGSENNKNWEVKAMIKSSFMQEDSDFFINSLAQPVRNTYFNKLEGFKVVPSPVSLNFGTVSYGTNLNKEPSLNYPLDIWNIGNVDIGVISLKSYKVNGTTTVDEYIPPAWFSTGDYSAGSICGYFGVDLIDETYVDTGLSNIFHGLGSYGRLGICLNQIQASHSGGSVSQQGYSTSGAGRFPWVIDVSYLLAAVVVRRKRRKKTKSLSRDLIDVFEKRLKERAGFGFDDLLKIAEEKKKKIMVPLDIFKERVGAAEVLTRYLKEVVGLRFSEIAELINRDPRTVSINFNNALKKGKDIKFDESSIFVSIKIFEDRRLSIFESLVRYLQEKGFKNTGIARILKRDQRNIATLRSRIKKKFN